MPVTSTSLPVIVPSVLPSLIRSVLVSGRCSIAVSQFVKSVNIVIILDWFSKMVANVCGCRRQAMLSSNGVILSVIICMSGYYHLPGGVSVFGVSSPGVSLSVVSVARELWHCLLRGMELHTGLTPLSLHPHLLPRQPPPLSCPLIVLLSLPRLLFSPTLFLLSSSLCRFILLSFISFNCSTLLSHSSIFLISASIYFTSSSCKFHLECLFLLLFLLFVFIIFPPFLIFSPIPFILFLVLCFSLLFFLYLCSISLFLFPILFLPLFSPFPSPSLSSNDVYISIWREIQLLDMWFSEVTISLMVSHFKAPGGRDNISKTSSPLSLTLAFP